ncbi:MAG: hypothetical protein AAB780_00225 [Patescibacteria group bacterium]
MKSSSNIALIVLAIGLFFSFTSPAYQEIKTLQASAGEYRSVIDNASHIAETRDALLVNYESIPKVEIDRLSKVLPDNIDAVRLALDLDTIAGRYGVAIKDLQVETKPNQNLTLAVLPDHSQSYQSATVTFSFVSNYSNFAKLLTDLEKSLRIMDVKSVIFKAAETGLYEHRVTVSTYWLK